MGGAALWIYEPAGETAKAPGETPGAAAPARPPSRPERRSPCCRSPRCPLDGRRLFRRWINEEVINALTALPDLLVTARTSAFYFKGKNVPVPDVAAALGVAHIVEGSVRAPATPSASRRSSSAPRTGFTCGLRRTIIRSPTRSQYRPGSPKVWPTRSACCLDERKRTMMNDIGVRDVEAFVAYQREWSSSIEPTTRAQCFLLARANNEFEAAIARKPDSQSPFPAC